MAVAVPLLAADSDCHWRGEDLGQLLCSPASRSSNNALGYRDRICLDHSPAVLRAPVLAWAALAQLGRLAAAGSMERDAQDAVGRFRGSQVGYVQPGISCREAGCIRRLEQASGCRFSLRPELGRAARGLLGFRPNGSSYGCLQRRTCAL